MGWCTIRDGLWSACERSSVEVPPTALAPFHGIGGFNGWYLANFLWWIRGVLDVLVGGVGLRRGRRDPRALSVGDALDFGESKHLRPTDASVLRPR